MDSTFTRATLGFIMLTAALALMAYVALWAIASFAGGAWWGSLVVVLIALASEIMIYSTTLHEPIYDWIREPKRLAEVEARSTGYEFKIREAIEAHVSAYHEGENRRTVPVKSSGQRP